MMRPLLTVVSWLVLGALAQVELPPGYSRAVPALWQNPSFVSVTPPISATILSRIVARDGCPSGSSKDPKCKEGVCCEDEGSCCGPGCCSSGYSCEIVNGVQGCCLLGSTCGTAANVTCPQDGQVFCPNGQCCASGQTCVLHGTVPACAPGPAPVASEDPAQRSLQSISLASTVNPILLATSSKSSTGGNKTKGASLSASKTSSGAAQKTSTNADTSTGSKGGNGLSRSDIIAIVACLLGVPGAIVAMLTLARCGD